jgi:hypothetical protein
MDVEVRIAGDGGIDALASLEDWLLADPELASCEVSRPAASPSPGEMGALTDILVVALGSGGVGVALANSLSVWLGTRVDKVTLRIGTQKGDIELTGHRAEDITTLIQALSIASTGSGS